MLNELTVGNYYQFDGCFTYEGYIIGQNIGEIARRLGLPQWRMKEGIYIAYALRVPSVNEFEMAGITLDSTDKFVSYDKNKMVYNADKFKTLYKGMNLQEMKQMYHKTFADGKLVKVIARKKHIQGTEYPEGTLVPQILITSQLPCLVAAYIPPQGMFTR